MEPKIRKQFY